MVAVSGSNDFNAKTRRRLRSFVRKEGFVTLCRAPAPRARPRGTRDPRTSRALEDTLDCHAIARDEDFPIVPGPPDAVLCAAARAPDIARELMVSRYSVTPARA